MVETDANLRVVVSSRTQSRRGGAGGMEKARQVAAGAGEVIGKGARVVQDKADEGHWVEKAQDQAQKATQSAKQYARPNALPPHMMWATPPPRAPSLG